jgi:plastocyanin
MFHDFLRAGAVMLLAVCAALAADVSGKWEFSVETSQGSGNPSFEFKQQGEKLTGTYSGLLGSAKVTGIVKGNEIEFTFDTDQAGKVRYKGTIESATRMKGEVDYGDLGKGTFTASKK